MRYVSPVHQAQDMYMYWEVVVEIKEEIEWGRRKDWGGVGG